MTPKVRWLPVLLAVLAALTGCSSTVQGSPTWPGERLERVLLSAADFPPGVQFDRIIENPGEPDGAGAPPAMLSDPPGCRSEERRVGQEWGSTWRSRWSPYH